jgi:hypothetical protein
MSSTLIEGFGEMAQLLVYCYVDATGNRRGTPEPAYCIAASSPCGALREEVRLVPVKLVILMALFGSTVGAVHAIAAPSIPPRELVPQARELPGFAFAKMISYWTMSAFEWAHGHELSEAQAKQETSELLREGFQEGIGSFFTGRREAGGRHREAVSEALVFATAQAAEHELSVSVAQTVRRNGREPGFHRFAVKAIPGAVGLGAFVPRKHGGSANVFFSVGRCFVMVGNAIHDAATRAEARRAPIVAAIALYKRAKRFCL